MKFKAFVLVILAGSSLADIANLEYFDAFKEHCDKKGGNGTYDKIMVAKDDTQDCLEKLIDIEKFVTEIEEAKKTGSMDEVFDKYCKKRPEMKACIKKTYDALEPCLEQEEIHSLNFTSYILTEIGDFACAKEGDRLAMFVAEGGVECIQNRTQGIQNCVKQTFNLNLENLSTASLSTFPKLTPDKKNCDDLAKLQTCVVDDLENCDESTPANLVDALFKFVKKTACKNVKRSIYFG